MANKHKGEVEITFPKLNNRSFKLRFDTNAWAEFEEAYGKSLMKVMEDIGEGDIGFSFIRAGLYAGLLCNPQIARGLTLRKVGDLIDDDNREEVVEKVVRAIMLSRGVDIDEMIKGEDQVSEADPTKGAVPPQTESTGTIYDAKLTPQESASPNSGT